MRTTDDEALHTASILPGGVRFCAPARKTLLAAALEAGIAWPSSCRNGTCRACLGRLRAGRVVYRIDWPGLSADEHRDGCILPCVAHPASDVCFELPV